MQTPDVLRSHGSGLNREVECRNPKCGRFFPYKPGKRYHDSACRSEHTQNSRQSLRRFKKLYPLLEIGDIPSEATGSLDLVFDPPVTTEQVWQELFSIDRVLFRDGPVDRDIALALRQRAGRLLATFQRVPPENREEELQYDRAVEIVWDIGTERTGGVRMLLGYATPVIDIYRRQGDYPRLSRALISLAMTLRLAGDEKNARKVIRHAYNAIADNMDHTNQEHLRLLHQALIWETRFCPDGKIGQSKSDTRTAAIQLAEVTKRITSPYAEIETTQEMLGYLADANRDLAIEASAKFQALLSRLPHVPKYAAPPRLRPDIERLLATRNSNDKEHAIEMIRTSYVSAYQEDPHMHYHKQALKWNKKFGLNLEGRIGPPRYVSPIRIFLPRKDGV